jgi:hypothetical protein
MEGWIGEERINGRRRQERGGEEKSETKIQRNK